MARILLAWELGAGLGHLLPHRGVVERLVAAGHEVHVVARQIERVRTAFVELPIKTWQAPVRSTPPPGPPRPPRSYADILQLAGFGDTEGLHARVLAWESILGAVRPNLTLVDFAPTALVALRRMNLSHALVGMPYHIPRLGVPLPPFPGTTAVSLAELQKSEADVVRSINASLVDANVHPLDALQDLFNQSEQNLLGTYPELDHFGSRSGGVYVGVPSPVGGERLSLPEGSGRRVFAYLKPAPWIEQFLAALRDRGLPTLIASDGLSGRLPDRFECRHIRLCDRPVDLNWVFSWSDLVVTNGNHTTTAQALRSGRPVLMFPLHMEQQLLADRVEALGAGLFIRRDELDEIETILDRLLNDDRFLRAASRFADSHAGHDEEEYTRRIFATLGSIKNR